MKRLCTWCFLGAALRSDITQIIQRIMQREEAKYKKLKCYVLPENLSEKYFADLLSRSYGCRCIGIELN